MDDTIITVGNRAVVITAQGPAYNARLYVNCRDGIASATATPMSNSFRTEAGAARWAMKVLAA